jgi:hypothetical protein
MAGVVTLEIEGRSYGIAPYKIAELRQAAPHVDRMNELVREAKALIEANAKRIEAGEQPLAPSMVSAMELLHETCEIVAVGLAKVDPAMTAEHLESIVDLSFQPSLQTAVAELMRSSGLASKGEATALSASQTEEGADEASQSSSAGSSQS